MTLDKIKKIIFWLFIVVFAIILFSEHLLDSDEGSVLNISWQLFNGKKMYVDFFEYSSPGAGYLIYFVWKVFGSANYWSAKLISIVFWLISAIGVYLISKKISVKSYIAYFSVLFWLVSANYYPLISHNVYSSFAAVWLLYFLIISLELKKKYLYAIAGFLGAVVFLFLQTKGLISCAIAVLIILLFSYGNWKNKVINSVIFLFTFLITLLIAFSAWDYKLIFYSLFVFPFEINYLANTFYNYFYIFAEILIIIVMAVFSWQWKNKNLAILTLFQAGLYLSSFNNNDLCHFMINTICFWIFFSLVIDKVINFLQFKISIKYLFYLYIFMLLFLVNITLIPWGIEDFILKYLKHNDQSVSSIYNIPELNQTENIYVGPFLPGLYFELRKPNPFIMINTMVLCNQQCFNKTLEIFKQVEPEYAIMCYPMVAKYYYNQDNPVDNYIKETYIDCQPDQTSYMEIFAKEKCPDIK